MWMTTPSGSQCMICQLLLIIQALTSMQSVLSTVPRPYVTRMSNPFREEQEEEEEEEDEEEEEEEENNENGES